MIIEFLWNINFSKIKDGVNQKGETEKRLNWLRNKNKALLIFQEIVFFFMFRLICFNLISAFFTYLFALFISKLYLN
jgi:uncharacterized protein YpuA (DUF1002 family)